MIDITGIAKVPQQSSPALLAQPPERKRKRRGNSVYYKPEVRVSGLRDGFTIPESRFVVIYDGVPVGCDFQSEVFALTRWMADHGVRATPAY